MNKRFFFLFLVFGLSFFLKSEAQVLEDYSDQWVASGRETWFDSNDRLLLPLDLNLFPQSYFYFRFPGQSVVFLGEKLWFFTEGDTTIITSGNFLKSISDTSAFELTLFKSGINLEDVSAKKLIEILEIPSESQFTEVILQKRSGVARQQVRDFFIFALLLTLFFVMLYKITYPYIFFMLIRPTSLLSAGDFSDSGSLQKFFSFDVLVFVLIVNLMSSLGLILGIILFKAEWLEARVDITFQNLTIGWLFGALMLLMLTVIKFTAVRIVAYLFELNKIEFAHFFYLLRLVMIATTVLILILAYFLMNDYYFAKSALGLSYSAFFWFYVLGVLVLFLIMMSRLSFKKYHLFTYLCIAELVPFLVIAKWVMILGE
jgi:hypothetical protein